MKRLSAYYWLILIILLGAFFRFYKLDWGEGFFFHPDEYHIAAAVDRLSFPNQMNPHLFSYGSFTVYLIYFTQSIFSLFASNFPLLKSHFPLLTSHFSLAILIGRFYSAFFSTLTIVLVFLISRKILSVSLYLYIALSLVATLPGLIQQSHFATPESNLTFFLFLTLLLVLQSIEQRKNIYLFLGAVSLGVALGTKVAAVTFLPPLLLAPLLNLQFNRPNSLLYFVKQALRLISTEVFLVAAVGLVFFFVFPYAILDYSSFHGSMNYEVGVGRGDPLVFYTRQFINTTPIVFQFQKILPYALGPGVLILGSLGLLGIIILSLRAVQKGKFSIINYQLSVIVFSFFFFFLPSAFLFAKWTRFIAPSFPFFAIFAAFFLQSIRLKMLRVLCYVLCVINLIWTLMFSSIYLNPDVRLTATDWINKNLPVNSQILVEGGNMLDVPLKERTVKLVSLDFYNYEEIPSVREEILEALNQSDYFIIQSRRVFVNHLRLKNKYPKTARLYEKLFSGELGFHKIREFTSFPQFSINDESAEETWSVFDHPVIRIYQKVKPLTIQDYENLLQI